MKGYLYTLEVVISIALLMIAITFVYKTEAQISFEHHLLKEYGINALQFLDANHTLRKFVYENNETYIETLLRNYIPKAINYEFSNNCDMINVPENKTVVTVSYYLAGYMNVYKPKKICLYLWG